jgi:hypothetical protein
MLLDQLRSEPYFVRGLLRENETRFTVPRSTLLRTSSGRAHESVLSVQSVVTGNSRLLLLAESLETGIAPQRVPDLSCSDWLESFLQLDVPEPAFDCGQRLVVAVLDVTGHKWRIRIEHVLHAKRDRRVI